MNKAIFILMLIIVPSSYIFAQTDQNNYNNDVHTRLNTMEKQIFDLYEKVKNLQDEVSILKPGSSVKNESLYDVTPKINIWQNTGNVFIFILILLIIIIVLISVLIILLKNRNQNTGNSSARYQEKEPEYSKPKPVSFTAKNNPSYNPSAPPSPPKSAPVNPGQGQTAKPPTTAAPPTDDMSILYRSGAERNNRTNNVPSDVFLDIPRSVYERMFQGENVQQLVLEKRGSRSTAMFILVKNKDLYPNFYSFNETSQLPKENEKILTMIYDFDKNSLPGYIRTCSPATVSASGDGSYRISIKGKLILVNRA